MTRVVRSGSFFVAGLDVTTESLATGAGFVATVGAGAEPDLREAQDTASRLLIQNKKSKRRIYLIPILW